MDLFAMFLIWGIPVLLVWSFILSIRHMLREPKGEQFLGRTLTFIGSIISYTIHSLAAWFGIICIIFGITAFTVGGLITPILFILFGGFLVRNYFPRFNMPE
ncbi:hypothetical protein [Cytobacillus gottheilii]|uniref:Uncharacterized protein n=1 Tax=Cytobacillus gottheilii TaxID=859144 RepID=A0ABX8FEY7_9BACI|nr:hypothetical protein [Cytobacillus gottheilii]QVY62588.1 hypothetical protein J1899_05865 [Cytobacillus gottheilii]